MSLNNLPKTITCNYFIINILHKQCLLTNKLMAYLTQIILFQ